MGKKIKIPRNKGLSRGKSLSKEEGWRAILSTFTGETTGIPGILSASWRK